MTAARARALVAATAPLVALFAFTCLLHVTAPGNLPGVTPQIEVVAIGVVRGLTLSLLAVGIGLVYRTNRIINFAQSNLGQVPGVLSLTLIIAHDWNYWLVFPLGIVAAAVLGVLVEFLLVRRFFRSPRLILTVATIGIAQVLAALSVFVARWLGSDTANSNNFTEPFHLTLTIGNRTFGGHEIMAMITVPIVLVALGAFLRFTTLGVALRGAAESADRASLLGIQIGRAYV